MKINKVYTRTGDKGTTSLVGGIRVSKTDIRIEAYGTVDELNSNIGLLASFLSDGDDKEILEHIQNTLFNICSYLATDTTKTPEYKSAVVEPEEVTMLEQLVDDIQQTLPVLHSFVLPGGTQAASIAHVCRTICRRAERRIYALADKVDLCDVVLSYINRLSDYLFVLARKLNFIEGQQEKIWHKSCK